MGKRFRNFLLTAGLISLTGCGAFSGARYTGPDITYDPYIKIIEEEAQILTQSNDPGRIKDGIDLYMAIRQIENAEPSLRRLIKLNPRMALSAMGSMQKERNENPELANR